MKSYTLIAAGLLTASVFAQAPQKMSYQVLFRSNSELIISSSVGMKISILQGDAAGTVVFNEVQTPETDANGG
jgi:hypothetical protein